MKDETSEAVRGDGSRPPGVAGSRSADKASTAATRIEAKSTTASVTASKGIFVSVPVKSYSKLLAIALLVTLAFVENRPSTLMQHLAEPRIDNMQVLPEAVMQKEGQQRRPTSTNRNSSSVAQVDSIKHSPINLFPTNDDKYYIPQMIQHNLTKSARHMQKFLQNKDVVATLPLQYRFRPDTASAAGVRLPGYTDNFSYLHIWKSGGTSMTKQVGQKHGVLRQMISRKDSKLLTFVRDPLDHFLSGWVECLSRWHRKQKKAKAISKQLASNVSGLLSEYLDHVKRATKQDKVACAIHSYPQVNFLLAPQPQSLSRKDGDSFFEQLRIIGDLSEMKGILSLVNFTYDDTKVSGKNSSENAMKQQYFRIPRGEIDATVIQQICDFMALDYYLLDYELPESCRHNVSDNLGEDSLFMRLNLTQPH